MPQPDEEFEKFPSPSLTPGYTISLSSTPKKVSDHMTSRDSSRSPTQTHCYTPGYDPNPISSPAYIH